MKNNIINRIRSIIIMFILTFNMLGINSLVEQAKVINAKLEYIETMINETVDIRTVKVEKATVPDNTVSPVVDIKPTSRSGGCEFTITAYDNSVESQGKWVDQTATGFNLKGHSLESAKCIAVDPTIIPLGSKVQLIFDDEYKHLNDVYIARDTGGAIKGKRIDLFMGDGVDKKIVNDFGKRKVKVIILD